MRILILDDDRSYGALLASASKKLGHRAIIKVDAQEAVQILRNREADIALVDLEMPNGSGTAFAKTLRRNGITVPVAFCTGTCADQRLIEEAEAMGQVLPKIWTHADLRLILSALQQESNSLHRLRAAEAEIAEITENDPLTPPLAHGLNPQQGRFVPTPPPVTDTVPAPVATELPDASMVDMPLTEPAAKSFPSAQERADETESGDFEPVTPQPNKRLQSMLEVGEALRETPRVNIGCSNWDQVRRLCGDVMRGMTTITVRARCEMRSGEDVVVALELPDEMVVSIGARVLDFRERSADGKRPYQLDLTGFGAEEIDYLLTCCDDNSPASSQTDSALESGDHQPAGPTPAGPTSAELEALHPAAGDVEEDTRSLTQPRIPEAIDSVEGDTGPANKGPSISWS